MGIVVGTAIFKTPSLVLQHVSSEWQSHMLWVLGGGLSLCGALCYAELATSLSRNGGEYVYLSRAYAPWLGFLFGWAQLTVVHSGTVGSMGYAFADYAMKVWTFPEQANAWLAAGAIVLLTILNLIGATAGKRVQNLLSSAKVLGLVGVIAAGITAPDTVELQSTSGGTATTSLGLALVFVLYAYGGWNDTAYVAAEVQHRERNLPRALLMGITGITVIYLLVNLACVRVLGIDAARLTLTPAADVMERLLGPAGRRGVSLLVMISALGAINGMIFTGARVYGVMSQDHRLFARFSHSRARLGAPVFALIAPGMVALLLILGVGTEYGQSLIDRFLGFVSVPGLPWKQFSGGFETLVAGTAPVFWSFFLLSGIAVFVLRWREPELDRPFRIPGYPIPPVIFCLVCAYMLYSSVDYARWLSLLGFVLLASGVPLIGWIRSSHDT